MDTEKKEYMIEAVIAVFVYQFIRLVCAALFDGIDEKIFYIFDGLGAVVAAVVTVSLFKRYLSTETRTEFKKFFTSAYNLKWLAGGYSISFLSLIIPISIALIIVLIYPAFINEFTGSGEERYIGKLHFIFAVLAGPVVEEFIFRGLCLEKLLHTTTVKKAIIIQALIFGIYHGNIGQFILGTLMGILLGIVYLHYRFIWPGVFIHLGFNLSVELYKYSFFSWNLDRLLIVWVILGLPSSVVSIFALRKYLKQRRALKDTAPALTAE